MKIRSKIILSFLTTLLSGTMLAQEYAEHEFSAWFAGGVSTLNYKNKVGDRAGDIGGSIGLGYTYFFTENYGIGTGLEYSMYNTKAEGMNFKHTLPNLVDPWDNEVYDFHSEITDYEEKQEVSYFSVPITFHYQIQGEKGIYASAGVKMGFFSKGKAKSTGNFVNKGYFHSTGNWADTQNFMAFGTFEEHKATNKDLDFKMSIALTAEAGMKWCIADHVSLYTGAFIDYGLTNIVDTDKQKKDFLTHRHTETGAEFSNNSIFTSAYNSGEGTSRAFMDKVKPMAFGVKFRLAIGNY